MVEFTNDEVMRAFEAIDLVLNSKKHKNKFQSKDEKDDARCEILYRFCDAVDRKGIEPNNTRYLHGIIKNVIREIIRGKKRKWKYFKNVAEFDNPLPSEYNKEVAKAVFDFVRQEDDNIECRLIRKEVWEYIEICMEDLTEKEKQMINMLYEEALSLRKIAPKFGLSYNTVRNRIKKGIHKIVKCLARQGIPQESKL